MKNLFKYYLKKQLPMIGIISVFFLVISVISIANTPYIMDTIYMEGSKNPGTTFFGLLAAFASILATIAPVYQFSFKMSKISVDEFYALPIKREKLFLTKYLMGVLSIFIPLTVCVLYATFTLFTREHLFSMQYLLPYYLSLYLATLILYTIFVFAFNRTNKTIDGIINMVLYMFVFLIITTLIGEIIDSATFLSPELYILYAPITIITNLFNSLFRGRSPGFPIEDILSLIFYLIIGIVSFILFIFLIKKDKAEDSMQISNSYFSYKSLIPIYLFCAVALINDIDLLLILAIMCSYFGYVIYQRTFKIKLVYLITILSCIGAGVILNIIIN